MEPIKKVNLAEKINLITDYWNPRIVGELNGQQVKLAKFKDEFILHQHEEEDEMFLVVKGKLKMELDTETIEINEGEFIIIPRKTNHKPMAIGEAHVLLFEPKSTLNTGDKVNKFTKSNLENI